MGARAFAVKKNHLEFYALSETLRRCRKQGIVVSLSKQYDQLVIIVVYSNTVVAFFSSSVMVSIRTDFLTSSSITESLQRPRRHRQIAQQKV